MKVRYIYSACVEIETPDVRILTDPWFTDGIYDGSWYQFPRIEEPLKVLSEPDIIYISHIHPDHYDPTFLHQLFDLYGKKRIITADFPNNFFVKKVKFDGFEIEPIKKASFGKTSIHILPNLTGSLSDIDSALLVNYDKETLLNLNDCVWSDNHVKELQGCIKKYCSKLDLLLLGYTGAGPFPQTYYDRSDLKKLTEKTEQKKEQFFKRYKRYCEAFPAKRRLSFAGKYLLGGGLAYMNEYRGIADAFEVKDFDSDVIILQDFGEGVLNLTNNYIFKQRTHKYSDFELKKRIEDISKNSLDYGKGIKISYDKINFERLIKESYKKALQKSEAKELYCFNLNIQKKSETIDQFLFGIHEDSLERNIKRKIDLNTPYSSISIDYRYLFGLLTGVYHWNNAEVGSLY